jgi:pimeloyl-ACP methyl ester carboxylesterase
LTAEPPLGPGTHGVAAADGVVLSLEVFGRGLETLLVPSAGNGTDFVPLQTADRSLACYDARNRGRSSAVDDPALLGFHREVADVATVREVLAPSGLSMLATAYMAGVVVCHAAEAPDSVERIVLVSPIAPRTESRLMPNPPPAPHELARLDQLAAQGARDRDPISFCRAWRRTYLSALMVDPAAFDRLADPCGCENEWPDRVSRALAHVFVDLGTYDWTDLLRPMTVPTLVVHGAEDPVASEAAEAWSDVLPVCRRHSVDDSGPFPWAERPDIFFPAVDEFLRGSWPAAAV